MKGRLATRLPRKSSHVWLAFLLGVSLVVAAMGWVTAKVIELDDKSQAAANQAQFEERVRLALWRLDSVAAPIIATEAAQPYFAYRAFFPADGAYRDMFETPKPGELLVPSPLLATDNPAVRLHFQIDDVGRLSSPQIPSDTELPDAAKEVLDEERLKKRRERLQALDGLMGDAYAQMVRRLPLRAGEEARAIRVAGAGDIQAAKRAEKDVAAARRFAQEEAEQARRTRPRKAPTPRVAPNTLGNDEVMEIQQEELNRSDYQRRLKSYGNLGSSQSAANVYKSGIASGKKIIQQLRQGKQAEQGSQAPTPPAPAQQASPPEPQRRNAKSAGLQVAPQDSGARSKPKPWRRRRPGHTIDVTLDPAPPKAPSVTVAPDTPTEGPMTPIWQAGQLLVARKVALGERDYIQGAWLDWQTVEQRLLASIGDLLPQARLVGVRANDEALATDASRRLASLPVRLEPGTPTPAGLGGLTPLRLSLLIAWGLLLAGALAVGALLRGALTLSERRGAFVSAVTHELRTPLTTFRMYTEMLAGGMVSDATKQQRYLDTLHAEAERLGHLVENVLAFAQIERRPDAAQVDDLALIPLIERLTDRLIQRAEQASMTLTVTFAEGLGRDDLVNADPGAVERILFNLVDNACKYGSELGEQEHENRISLEVSLPDSATARIAVRDFGAGVDPDDVATVFRPFHKSAKKAATTAPGVGLGLALCRRLAIAMGGNLRHEAPVDGVGARFVLTLPRSH